MVVVLLVTFDVVVTWEGDDAGPVTVCGMTSRFSPDLMASDVARATADVDGQPDDAAIESMNSCCVDGT